MSHLLPSKGLALSREVTEGKFSQTISPQNLIIRMNHVCSRRYYKYNHHNVVEIMGWMLILSHP